MSKPKYDPINHCCDRCGLLTTPEAFELHTEAECFAIEIKNRELKDQINKEDKMEEKKQEVAVVTQIRDVAPTLVGTLADTEKRYKELQEFIKKQMVENEDYGKIPGCPKPSLFKPGAEKLLEIYGYAVSDIQVTNKVEDWEKGFFHYEMKAIATSKRSGQIVGTGIGSCNTKEKKYINQDPFSLVNTIEKMAKKRAIVDLALLVTRSSAIFTQDVEDMVNENSKVESKPAPQHTKEILNTKEILTISEAQKLSAGSTFDVVGILSDMKLDKVGAKKSALGRYKILSEDSQFGMDISVWGELPTYLKLGDTIRFLIVVATEYKGKLQYLASGIELIESIPQEE